MLGAGSTDTQHFYNTPYYLYIISNQDENKIPYLPCSDHNARIHGRSLFKRQ